MIYNANIELEKKRRVFNSEPFTIEQIKKLCDHHNITPLTDHTVDGAVAYRHRRKNIILDNPILTAIQLVLNLGHEFGHFPLGHVKDHGSPLHMSDPFADQGKEKDAGIIGFLMWLPTKEICKMIRDGRIDIEEVLNFSRYIDPDLTEDEALEICNARIRIFNALRRVSR